MRPTILLAVLVLFASLAPAPASAQTTADHELAAARELVLHASYRDALTHARTFLERTDLDAQHRNAGLEVLAIAQLVLHDAGAQATLSQLYSRDPGHRLDDPDASPVVQSAFARARESAALTEVPIVDGTNPAPSARGVPTVSLAVGASADAVHELRVHYRQLGEPRYLSIVLSAEADGTATTPLAVNPGSAPYVVEYYVEALAPSSTVIGRLGSPDSPRELTMPAEATVASEIAVGPGDRIPAPGGGVESEAWFWIVIGVVVVGAGVGIGAGVVLSQPTAQPGSLDTVQLPLITF